MWCAVALCLLGALLVAAEGASALVADKSDIFCARVSDRCALTCRGAGVNIFKDENCARFVADCPVSCRPRPAGSQERARAPSSAPAPAPAVLLTDDRQIRQYLRDHAGASNPAGSPPAGAPGKRVRTGKRFAVFENWHHSQAVTLALVTPRPRDGGGSSGGGGGEGHAAAKGGAQAWVEVAQGGALRPNGGEEGVRWQPGQIFVARPPRPPRPS